MPDPTVSTQEIIVDGQVRDMFGGESYESYVYEGDTYYTFESEPYQRWVDADSDGWFDYGLRDDGYGHWSVWDGFTWSRHGGQPGDGDMETTNIVAPPGEDTAMTRVDGGLSSASAPTMPTDPGLGMIEPALTIDSGDWFF